MHSLQTILQETLVAISLGSILWVVRKPYKSLDKSTRPTTILKSMERDEALAEIM